MVPLHLTLKQHPWPAAVAVSTLACCQHPGRWPLPLRLPLRLPLLLPCRGDDHVVPCGNGMQQAAQHHSWGMRHHVLQTGMQAWGAAQHKEPLLHKSKPAGPHAVRLTFEGLTQLREGAALCIRREKHSSCSRQSSQTSGTHPGEAAASSGTSSSGSSSCLRPEACCRSPGMPQGLPVNMRQQGVANITRQRPARNVTDLLIFAGSQAGRQSPAMYCSLNSWPSLDAMAGPDSADYKLPDWQTRASAW